MLIDIGLLLGHPVQPCIWIYRVAEKSKPLSL